MRPFIVWMTCGLMTTVGCSLGFNPADPESYETLRDELVTEWDEICPKGCDADPAPSICVVPDVTRTECGLYDPQEAQDCIRVLKKVNRKEICDAGDQTMINVGDICDDVYSDCAVPGDTDDTGTDSDGDTDGMDSDGETGDTMGNEMGLED